MSVVHERLGAALRDRYRIERELGAGGMATVFLAEDLKHDRKVAIKVLKPELAAVLGAERFVQEIKTTAALSHPHLLPLFDSGEAAGFLYYVMPYIQGETIRERLNRETQLGVDEAVRITVEVADALDYAHRHGVIHRDIKPENILLHDGRAMVMDFGIALAVSAAAGGRMTETGLSLGTPHYMSPEQATADKDLTNRSDVYSLASVLYEMLTGHPPHVGASAQQIIMKIVTEDAAPVTTHRKSVPVNVAAALGKALEKLPADRFESAKAFAEALANPAYTVAGPSGRHAAPQSRRPWLSDPRTIATLGLGVVGIALAATLGRPSGRGVPAEYDVGLPDSAGLMTASQDIGFAVSPGGDFAVYETVRRGRSELWFRSLVDGTVRRIGGTDDATQPALSPDGKRIAFFRARGDGWTLEVLPVEGGTATTLGQGAGFSRWLAWHTDGRLLVLQSDGTQARWFDPEGGLVTLSPIPYCVGVPVPGDTGLLCGGGGRKWGYRVLDAATQRTFWRAEDSSRVYGASFRVVDERYLTYVSVGGDLLAAPVDLRTGRVGKAVRMASGLGLADYTGLGSYAVATSGTLVYVQGDNKTVGSLVRVRDEGVDTLPVGSASFITFSYSPDGRRLAAVVEGLEGRELRIYDLSSGRYQTWIRLPTIGYPAWSPAGDRLVFDSNDSLFVGSPDRSGPPEFLWAVPEGLFATGWLPNDRVYGVRWTPNAAVAIWLDRRPITVDSLFSDNGFVWPSPDGRWIAYTNAAFTEAWLEPLPGDGRRYQVSTGSLGEIRWLSSSELGVSIMDRPDARMERATVAPGANPPLRNLRRWVDLPDFRDTDGPSLAVPPDGGVVYLRGAANRPAAYFRVIRNWVTQMKRAVDEANR